MYFIHIGIVFILFCNIIISLSYNISKSIHFENKKMKKAILGALYFVPALAFAQANFGNLTGSLANFNPVLQAAARVLFGLAIVYFFWGVAKYILAASDAKAREEGRGIMIWGIVAIAVMASIYGLVTLLSTTFVGTGGTVTVPTLP